MPTVKVKVRHGEMEVISVTPGDVSIFVGPFSTSLSTSEARALALALSVMAEQAEKSEAAKLQSDWVHVEAARRRAMYASGPVVLESGCGVREVCDAE